MVLLFMRFAFFAERLSVGVEPAEGPHQISFAHTEPAPPGAQRRGVRRFLRPKASITSAGVGRAQSAAANLGHRAEAGRALRDHHADRAALFALHAEIGRA